MDATSETMEAAANQSGIRGLLTLLKAWAKHKGIDVDLKTPETALVVDAEGAYDEPSRQEEQESKYEEFKMAGEKKELPKVEETGDQHSVEQGQAEFSEAFKLVEDEKLESNAEVVVFSPTEEEDKDEGEIAVLPNSDHLQMKLLEMELGGPYEFINSPPPPQFFCGVKAQSPPLERPPPSSHDYLFLGRSWLSSRKRKKWRYERERLGPETILILMGFREGLRLGLLPILTGPSMFGLQKGANHQTVGPLVPQCARLNALAESAPHFVPHSGDTNSLQFGARGRAISRPSEYSSLTCPRVSPQFVPCFGFPWVSSPLIEHQTALVQRDGFQRTYAAQVKANSSGAMGKEGDSESLYLSGEHPEMPSPPDPEVSSNSSKQAKLGINELSLCLETIAREPLRGKMVQPETNEEKLACGLPLWAEQHHWCAQVIWTQLDPEASALCNWGMGKWSNRILGRNSKFSSIVRNEVAGLLQRQVLWPTIAVFCCFGE